MIPLWLLPPGGAAGLRDSRVLATDVLAFAARLAGQNQHGFF